MRSVGGARRDSSLTWGLHDETPLFLAVNAPLTKAALEEIKVKIRSVYKDRKILNHKGTRMIKDRED